jgi:hypothetical protein
MFIDGHRPGADLDIPSPEAVTAVTANVTCFSALTQGFDKVYATG